MSKPVIVIFAFNRPQALKNLIDSLKTNIEYYNYPIRIYIDGPRTEEERSKVNSVIEIAKELTEDVITSSTNKGLGPSIISGVSEVLDSNDKVIVLEDDLVLMPGFLSYMDAALEKYKNDKNIFSVCGYGLKIKRPKNYYGDVYLCNRSSSWGWATWRDRWNSVDWEVKDWEDLKNNPKLQKEFNQGGSDMYGMLKDYMEGRNRSWAIRFCYSQHKQKKFSVHPFKSLVANEGYGIDATNCKQKYSRFKVDLAQNPFPINMPVCLKPDIEILKNCKHYHSLYLRLYSKIRRILNV